MPQLRITNDGDRFYTTFDPPRIVQSSFGEHRITRSGFASLASLFEYLGIEETAGEYLVTVERL